MLGRPSKDEVKLFLFNVLGLVDHKELLCQRGGQRKLMQMWLAASVVAKIVKPDLNEWASSFDTARALDAVEEFRPDSVIAKEWVALKRLGLVVAGKGRGRGAEKGRDLLAVSLVNYLSENELMTATRNHHEASKLKQGKKDSACDVVAEVLSELCDRPVTYDAIRNAWEKRS